ncbi:MAG: hypothetical protein HLUCCA11_23640 [Phormidesmis priestleyi Ana]|uniref:Uncharacterized protein n=1 Tax=Phormidesmis priestleyi Ana TaxID=1666911 RepID=A0A0N8KLP2_9CYAN|nr:MAG: hypothetical protein HLUCCA11_23640 [Phormidesmis priestleyi Ana]
MLGKVCDGIAFPTENRYGEGLAIVEAVGKGRSQWGVVLGEEGCMVTAKGNAYVS